MISPGEEAGSDKVTGRRWQGALFLFLCLALSIFLMGHSLIVSVEATACLENFAASVNGERPYLRVAEMSLRQLAYAAGRRFSVDELIVGTLGLFPLVPFWVAWMNARDRPSRQLWMVAAVIALIVIVWWVFTSDLTGFYDCDLNGVSLGILFMPLVYTAAALVATLVLALLRSIVLLAMGRE